MRTIFTTDDIRNILENLFENSTEKIAISNEYGETTEHFIKDYLNLKFYTYKLRMEDTDTFSQALTDSINTTLGIVEMTNSKVIASQDIDSATYEGKCTIIMQTEKAQILEMFLTKLRNSLLGVPQDIQNSYGDMLKAYIVIGTLIYEEQPDTTQYGETIQVSFNFTINYLTEALNYNDTPISISFNDIDYYQIPYIQGTIQNIIVTKATPKQNRPDIMGSIATSVSKPITISFYDFNNDLMVKLNEYFWKCCAIEIDNESVETQNVNNIVFLKVTSNGHTYKYKYLLANQEKVLKNGEFNISSITLQTSALGE